MSIVSLLNVNVLNNPARFTDPYELEITFECLEPLREDLEWKLVYVGSSTSSEHDQELESILVGPVPVGVNKFLFTADPPAPDLIPQSELVSVTVMLLTCSYRDRDFVQVGYYVNNEYDTEELRENPPSRVVLDHVYRNILAEKPRVTRFNIPWDGEATNEFPPEQPDADLEANESDYGNEEEDAMDELVDRDEADEAEAEAEDDVDGDEGDGEGDGDEDLEEEEDDIDIEGTVEPVDEENAGDYEPTSNPDAAGTASGSRAADTEPKRSEPSSLKRVAETQATRDGDDEAEEEEDIEDEDGEEDEEEEDDDEDDEEDPGEDEAEEEDEEEVNAGQEKS